MKWLLALARPSKFKFVVLLLAFSCCNRGIAQDAQKIPVPDQITEGFDLFATKGMGEAWDRWNEDGYLTERTQTSREAFVDAMSGAQARNGKPLGFELIKEVAFGSSYCRFYFLWRFEKKPVFVGFSCYKPADKWMVINFWIENDPVTLNKEDPFFTVP
jgi:hypothetical protein